MTPQFQGGRRGPSRGRGPKSGPTTASPKSSEPIRPLHPTLTPPDIESFRHWELGEEIQTAIEAMGITVPSPIQRLAIGPVLAGKDVIAKAETGTGKTLAFGAPMMAKIDPARASVLGLVLTPTRELAEQVQNVLIALGKPRGIEVALVVGGEPLEPQVKALKRGAQVVVGTPGRILDLYKQKFLSFPWTEFAILDEADVMFEFGFIDDVKEILSYTPDERQTLLFSATFPSELLKLARENTRDPAEVATAAGLKTVDSIEQSVIFLDDEDRTLALMRLIENSDPEDTFLVFCPRRTDVDKLIRRLERMPFSIKALHGGYDQAARFRVMAAFRTGEVKALIATDVASRGLDVKHVSTVVNYGSPHDITDYTHRIGRTGRAGRKGRAITLVGGIDRRKWTQIEREATWKIPEVDPPLRGERPRPRRDEVPVGAERERVETPRERTESPRARDERPREERPRAPRGRDERPRSDAPRSAAPNRGPRRDAPPSRAHGDAPRPERSWPRDEHSPVHVSEPERQIEPRPDDPVDRRERPLRQRAEAPRWPADDDAPRREEDSRSTRTGAERAPHTARADAERAPRTARTDAERAPRTARADADRAPRTDRAAPSERGPRTARAPAPDRAPHAARAPRVDRERDAQPPQRPALFAPEPESGPDLRPRGPDRPASRTAGHAAPRTPRAEPSATPRAARDTAPRASSRDSAERAPRDSAERAPRDSAERAPRDSAERAPRDTAPRAPRDAAPRAPAGTTPRAPARPTARDDARAPAARSRDDAPRAREPRRADAPPRAAPARESAPDARRAPAPRADAAPRGRPSVPYEPRAPVAPRPSLPRRRVGEPDPGEVRPLESRRREPRPDR